MPARMVRIEPSVDSLLASAERREAWKTADSLSGSRFERVTINGDPFVVKYVCVDDDWIMRATGDLHCRQLALFASPLLDSLPASIDPVVVAWAPYASTNGHRGAALLMPNVADQLVEPGDTVIDMERHRGFLAHIADLHAQYWNFHDGVGLFPLAHHYVFLTPTMAALETATERSDPVPRAVLDGWSQLAQRFPEEARVLLDLANDPSPLVDSLQRWPATLLHGDLKFGNMGGDASRTILLDWDRCGEGPPLIDLAWYVAVNCDRLPEPKTDVIAAYRTLLEARQIDTTPWWDSQLRTALAGAFVQLGWSKVSDADEFGWWCDRLNEWQRSR
jgi:Phosphotransferase enzyme family